MTLKLFLTDWHHCLCDFPLPKGSVGFGSAGQFCHGAAQKTYIPAESPQTCIAGRSWGVPHLPGRWRMVAAPTKRRRKKSVYSTCVETITQRNKAITLWSWAQCSKWNDPIQEQYWQITHFKIHISRKALWKDVSAVTANSTTWELWLSAFIAPIKYAMLHRKFVAKHFLNYCLLNWEHSSWESNSQFVESNNKSSITPFCCIVFSQDPGKETTSIHFFMVFVSSVCNEMSLQARIMNNLLLSVFQFLHFPARRNSHWFLFFSV